MAIFHSYVAVYQRVTTWDVSVWAISKVPKASSFSTFHHCRRPPHPDSKRPYALPFASELSDEDKMFPFAFMRHGENTHFELTLSWLSWLCQDLSNRYLRTSNEVTLRLQSAVIHAGTWHGEPPNTAISTPKYSPIVSDDVYVLKVKCKFNMATQPPVLTYTITYM